MKFDKKSVTVKGYGNRKHEIAVETTEMSGHVTISLKKNGNNILTCGPKEFVKLKKFFSEI
tara:strand:+ start:295 stop:477 length:183 start_codon:yes stop_codon:yes gene_type:complete